MNGRKVDVIIQDIDESDTTPFDFLWDAFDTRFQEPSKTIPYRFAVIADPFQEGIIANVEGVLNVFFDDMENKYTVHIDQRYDKEYIKEAVKAAILIGNVTSNPYLTLYESKFGELFGIEKGNKNG